MWDDGVNIINSGKGYQHIIINVEVTEKLVVIIGKEIRKKFSVDTQNYIFLMSRNDSEYYTV